MLLLLYRTSTSLVHKRSATTPWAGNPPTYRPAYRPAYRPTDRPTQLLPAACIALSDGGTCYAALWRCTNTQGLKIAHHRAWGTKPKVNIYVPEIHTRAYRNKNKSNEKSAHQKTSTQCQGRLPKSLNTTTVSRVDGWPTGRPPTQGANLSLQFASAQPLQGNSLLLAIYPGANYPVPIFKRQ